MMKKIQWSCKSTIQDRDTWDSFFDSTGMNSVAAARFGRSAQSSALGPRSSPSPSVVSVHSAASLLM